MSIWIISFCTSPQEYVKIKAHSQCRGQAGYGQTDRRTFSWERGRARERFSIIFTVPPATSWIGTRVLFWYKSILHFCEFTTKGCNFFTFTVFHEAFSRTSINITIFRTSVFTAISLSCQALRDRGVVSVPKHCLQVYGWLLVSVYLFSFTEMVYCTVFW